MSECVAVIGVRRGMELSLLRGFDARNDLCVCINLNVHICISILGLVLGEKVEVFAQRAGEL